MEEADYENTDLVESNYEDADNEIENDYVSGNDEQLDDMEVQLPHNYLLLKFLHSLILLKGRRGWRQR